MSAETNSSTKRNIVVLDEDKNNREKIQKINNNESEDDSMECSICTENWTSVGSHKLVALKCGHFYGRSCIFRWIEKTRTAKPQCPHCKQNIQKSDIRPVLPINISIQDVVEEQAIKHELYQAKSQLADYGNQLEKTLLAISMTKRELNRLINSNKNLLDYDSASNNQMNIIDDNSNINSRNDRNYNDSDNDNGSNYNDIDANCNHNNGNPPVDYIKYFQHYRTEYLSSKNLSTYAMALNKEKKKIYVTSKKSGKYGVDTINIQNIDKEPFLPIHSGVIRDIKCQNDYLLTSGYDKSMKLTSIKDKKIIESYSLNSPGYCCSFDIDDSSPLLYCGLANGSTVVYDKRHSKSPLCLLNDRNKTGGSPVHSLEVIRVNNKSIILCANLTKLYAWELDSSILTHTIRNDINNDTVLSSNISHQCHVLSIDNIEDFKPYSLRMNSKDETLLFSLRRHNSTKHFIMKLLDDLTLESKWSFGYPSEQKCINRTLEFNLENKSIVCFSDGIYNNLCLQDNDGYTKIYPIGERIYDIQYQVLNNDNNNNNPLIAVLTSSKVQLYRYF